MSKKDDVKAELTKLGIEFDETATTAELEALLPGEDAVRNEPEDAPTGGISLDTLVVDDAAVIKPQDLPLVIKPPVGQDWLNPEQAEYAKVLNAAAYANKNWKNVRDVELARLVEIGNDPEKYYFYTGTAKDENSKFSITNKLLGE